MDGQNKRGGARPGSGRKPSPEGGANVPTTIKLKQEQHAKLQRLGGAPWVRRKIDEEPEPPAKE